MSALTVWKSSTPVGSVDAPSASLPSSMLTTKGWSAWSSSRVRAGAFRAARW